MEGSLIAVEDAAVVKPIQNGAIKASLSYSIPIVDLNLLSSPNTKEREEEMEKFRLAVTSWGCFQAIGHNIPTSLLDKVHNTGKEFFELPKADKSRYWIHDDRSKGYSEGYGTAVVASRDQVVERSDDRQFLSLKMKPEDERRLELWPENPICFRETMHEYSTKTSLVYETILKNMAKTVGLEENYFINLAGERSQSFARYHYYPPCSNPDVFGIGAHSDTGAITLLLQDKRVEGLQALIDGQWITVPVIPHALFVSVSDQIEIMSNGVFKSLIHRVVLNSEMERISLGMFYWPAMEKDVEPDAKFIDENRPRLFNKVNMKDYAVNYVKRNMTGKRALDWVKV